MKKSKKRPPEASHIRARAQREAERMPPIERSRLAKRRICGADEIWMRMNRDGNGGTHCTVGRLNHCMGLPSAVRSKTRTEATEVDGRCPLDEAKRQFKAGRPRGVFRPFWPGAVQLAEGRSV